MAQNFDGLIVEPTKSAFSNPNITYYLELERLSIPYIMINAYYDELEPISITLNEEKGGFSQVEYLINRGHKHIAGLFKTDDMQGAKRLKGYLQAHRHYGIPIDPSLIISYNTDEKNKKPIVELNKLLDSHHNEITALACYNDELAMEVLKVLRSKKLGVPEDMSVIGYDDSLLAEISEVKLTSVQHPKSEIGKIAANKIIELIRLSLKTKRSDLNEIKSVQYEPKITIRDSVKDLNCTKINTEN